MQNIKQAHKQHSRDCKTLLMFVSSSTCHQHNTDLGQHLLQQNGCLATGQCTKVNEIKDLHLLLLDKSSAFRKREDKKSVQVQRGTALLSYIF